MEPGARQDLRGRLDPGDRLDHRERLDQRASADRRAILIVGNKLDDMAAV